MVKKGLGPEAKKEYQKPEITRNEPLVDITFGTPTVATAAAGTLTGTAGSPGTLITSPKVSPGGATLTGGDLLDDGGDGGDYDAGTLTGSGTVIPGTGGAPGTVL